jgi:hypothetical protein
VALTATKPTTATRFTGEIRWSFDFSRATIKPEKSAAQVEPHVKVLRSVSIFCQKDRCEEPATHLFRTDKVAAYCGYTPEQKLVA